MTEEIKSENVQTPEGEKPEQKSTGTEKTFTQAELDKILTERLSREKSGFKTQSEAYLFRQKFLLLRGEL